MAAGGMERLEQGGARGEQEVRRGPVRWVLFVLGSFQILLSGGYRIAIQAAAHARARHAALL